MRLSKYILIGTFIALSGATAKADVVTQTVQFGPGPTDYNTATGVTGSGTTFNFFNSNLGTLNSIMFSSSYGFASTITVTNTSASASSGNVRTQSGAQFTSSNSGISSVLNSIVNVDNDPVDGTAVEFGSATLSPIAYDLRGTRSNYTLATGATTAVMSSGNGTTGPITDTSAADLAAFSLTGGGTYTPLLTTLSGLIISNNGGNTIASQTTLATGTLTISYNFTPTTNTPGVTPEPSSLALLGTGILGVLGVARRRFL